MLDRTHACGVCRQVRYGLASSCLSRQVDLVYEGAVEGTGTKVAREI